MEILQISILSVAISACVLFGLFAKVLLPKLSLVYFRCFLLLAAFNFALEWMLASPVSPYKPFWLGLMMASWFWMAPCVWLFALESADNKTPSLKVLKPLEWALIGVGFILTLPLWIAAPAGTDWSSASGGLRMIHSLIHESMLISIFLFLIQVPWYIRRCWLLFEARLDLNRFLFSQLNEPGVHVLRMLVWLMAAYWLIGFGRTLHEMILDYSPAWGLGVSLLTSMVTLWALLVIAGRGLRFQARDQQLLEQLENAKYVKSALDKSRTRRIAGKIEQAFSIGKIFQNSNLTLAELATAIGEKPHYASQTISQEMGTRFYDLANRYRVEAAKKRLLEKPEEPVFETALAVGFNSKSTFNATFKKFSGVTPSAYRKCEVIATSHCGKCQV